LASPELSVTAVAAEFKISRKQLSDIVDCREGISPEMAIRLDKAFGGGAATWHRLQAAYDLTQVMKNADKIRWSGGRFLAPRLRPKVRREYKTRILRHTPLRAAQDKKMRCISLSSY
jgi:addiction module HigA family antidote